MKLVLYSAPGSNCSQRVDWALIYKGIPFEKHSLDDPSDSPYGLVPALSIDGTVVAESMAIAEFLDEAFPPRPLLPADPLHRALVREICEYVNSTIHPPQCRSVMDFLKPGMTDDDRRAARSRWISDCLLRLKPRLFGGGQFAIGDSFTLADIFVAVIYAKGLSLGAERDADYDSHNRLLIDVPGYQVMTT